MSFFKIIGKTIFGIGVLLAAAGILFWTGLCELVYRTREEPSLVSCLLILGYLVGFYAHKYWA